MKLDFVEGLSWPGDRTKPNDDAFCHADTLAAVFDGATGINDSPLLPVDSDAAWIARRGAEGLISHQALGARAALRQAAVEAEQDFNRLKLRALAERYELPLASMMLIGVEDDALLALWFGDCAALVRRPGERVQLLGDAFDKRAREAGRAARLAKKMGISPTSGPNRPEFLPSLRQSRNHVNTVAGSWAFSPNAQCAEHVQALPFTAPAGSDILICSDGFLALASDYRRYDVDGLMDAVLAKGLRALLEEVRRVEEDDAEGRAFPRFKKSDDATALLLKLA
jgi:hypothetical protein